MELHMGRDQLLSSKVHNYTQSLHGMRKWVKSLQMLSKWTHQPVDKDAWYTNAYYYYYYSTCYDLNPSQPQTIVYSYDMHVVYIRICNVCITQHLVQVVQTTYHLTCVYYNMHMCLYVCTLKWIIIIVYCLCIILHVNCFVCACIHDITGGWV